MGCTYNFGISFFRCCVLRPKNIERFSIFLAQTKCLALTCFTSLRCKNEDIDGNVHDTFMSDTILPSAVLVAELYVPHVFKMARGHQVMYSRLRGLQTWYQIINLLLLYVMLHISYSYTLISTSMATIIIELMIKSRSKIIHVLDMNRKRDKYILFIMIKLGAA